MTESFPLASTAAIFTCFIPRAFSDIFVSWSFVPETKTSHILPFICYIFYIYIFFLSRLCFQWFLHAVFSLAFKLVPWNIFPLIACFLFSISTKLNLYSCSSPFLPLLHYNLDKSGHDQTTPSSTQVWGLSWFSCISFKIIAF